MALATKARVRKVKFTLSVPDAKEVMLTGDFNNWDFTQTPLKRNNRKSKIWETELNLKLGRYEYKFVVDGNWISDPSNSNRSWNSFGTENSVIEVK